MEFELVVPCYNESKTLERLLSEVVKAAKDFDYTPDRFQLVLVQNGSTDHTAVEALRLKSLLGAWYRVVTIPKNEGYGNGIWAGLKATEAPFVGWSHADLQCSPRDAFRALKLLKESPQECIVRGIRTDRHFKDVFVSWVFEFLSRVLLGAHAHETNAQPKVFERTLLKHIVNPPKHFGFDLYVLFCAERARYQQHYIEVSFPPRVHGVSKWAGTLWQRHKTILGMIRYLWLLRQSEGRLR